MAGTFDRTEDGVTGAEIYEALSLPIGIGASVILPTSDSGKTASASVIRRAHDQVTAWAVEINNDPSLNFFSISPRAIVDYVLDEYAK